MLFLIADDEAPARDTIREYLNVMGYTDIIEVEDGVKALEAIEIHKPDIVLADVRMPGMDGLEVLLKSKRLEMEPIFIIISGYSLFEYAQKAIDLQAFKYLLKPISYNEFESVVGQALKKAEQKNTSNTDVRIKGDKALDYLRHDFIRKLLLEKPLSEKYVANKLKELNMEFLMKYFCVVLLSLDGYSNMQLEMSQTDIDFIKADIENTAGAIIKDTSYLSYSFSTKDGTAFLMNLQGDSSSVLLQEIYGLFNKVTGHCRKKYKITVTIGISGLTENIYGLNNYYDLAYKAITQRMVRGGNQVFCIDTDESEKLIQAVISSKLEQELMSSMERCDVQKANELIAQLYGPFLKAGIFNTEDVMKLNLKVIFLISKVLTQNSILSEDAIGDEFMLYGRVNCCEGTDSILKWFDNLLLTCFDYISLKNKKREKKPVEIAREYIANNYNKGITLEFVAEQIHISPNHFSRIFKMETGINFVDYIAALRVNKAKELLKTEIHKVSEVSVMVGFNDVKYFCRIFRKLTGFTPSDYRNLK